MTDFYEYQQKARDTAIYPDDIGLFYTTLGLVGEAGEIAEKVKKLMRDDDKEFDEEFQENLAHELGDVLWYLANLSHEIGYSLEDIATMNLRKLASRADRGKLQGDGDNR